MSTYNIEIIIFDINNFEDEEIDNDEKEKKEKCIINKEILFSYKVINHFIKNHILIDMEMEENEDYNEYSFIYQIQKGITKQCKFYLFYRVTQESFTIDSNALLIFCDLENEKSKELLKKVIENIKKICQQDIRIYILGIIKGNKECILNQESISKLFKEEEINIKYNEMNIKNSKEERNKINDENNNLNKEDNNKDDNNKRNEENNKINIEININNENDKDNEINNLNKENIINNEENNNDIIKNNENNNIIKEEKEGKQKQLKKDEEKLEENIKEKDIFAKIDKFIEKALIDIYKYEKSKKEKEKEFDKEVGKNNSCLLY